MAGPFQKLEMRMGLKRYVAIGGIKVWRNLCNLRKAKFSENFQ